MRLVSHSSRVFSEQLLLLIGQSIITGLPGISAWQWIMWFSALGAPAVRDDGGTIEDCRAIGLFLNTRP
ncbi:hypothetical protein GJAV_G00215790 [Gymnothorax javanicus]|nr:hypothetical protein GJAV_G00215790 [Gymnothorax javanicus]